MLLRFSRNDVLTNILLPFHYVGLMRADVAAGGSKLMKISYKRKSILR